MERDFMGLNSKESVLVVREEVSDGGNDSAIVKAQGFQWPFGNKVSAVTQFLSNISAQEDAPNKTACVSSGFTQNLAGFPFKQSPSAGLAYPRTKSAGSPAQMTIFYNGTVKVYDSITLEKAKAIMFLAGNSSCLVTSDARAGTQVRLPTPKFDATDVVPVGQRVSGQPSSTISSPISVSSHNGAQSVSSSTSTDEPVSTKPTVLSSFSPDCKRDHSTKPITAFGSVAAPSTIPRGISQSRKLSLARFLEKRKERAMNAAPYNAAKKPECAS